MAAGTQLQTLLDQINVATNKQAAALTRQGAAITTIANTQRTIGDELDTLIVRLKGAAGVDPAIIDGLTKQAGVAASLADALESQADTLDQQAAFSSALASKGDVDVVPAVVPEAPPDAAGIGAPLPPVGLG